MLKYCCLKEAKRRKEDKKRREEKKPLVETFQALSKEGQKEGGVSRKNEKDAFLLQESLLGFEA